jgi:murein DD-endopeptidase MepM/ murein hydrolase activator NlpD
MKRIVFVAIASSLLSRSAEAQQYRFPMELPGPGEQVQYVTAYRDLAGAGLQDWNCGTNTYDGHRGTDIGIGGFAVMDNGSRWIVAAAPGTVTFVSEGCFDRCTTADCNCGGGFGNYVKVTHADGKSTFYGHMMQNSVQVSLNDTVTCGQRLGKVGSSGFSTGPHLHFEPRYSDNTSDDPFSGPCGGGISFWVDQGVYNDLPASLCEGQPPPTPEGAIKGVVWDRGVTDGPNDTGNVRLPGTMVTIEGGASTAGRDPDGYWTFTLAPGPYRVTATRDGYEAQTKEVTVVQGQDVWASFGMLPNQPPAVDQAELLDETPDPLTVGPDERFEKAWRVKNTGNTTWNSAYHLQLVEGEALGAPATIALAEEVAPGAEHAITLLLTSSSAAGMYGASWSLARDGVGTFGPLLDIDIVVEVNAPDPDPDPMNPDPMNPDPPMKDPITMGQPGDPMDQEDRELGRHVTGGCRCESQPASPAAGVFLVLTALAVTRARPRSRRAASQNR